MTAAIQVEDAAAQVKRGAGLTKIQVIAAPIVPPRLAHDRGAEGGDRRGFGSTRNRFTFPSILIPRRGSKAPRTILEMRPIKAVIGVPVSQIAAEDIGSRRKVVYPAVSGNTVADV